MVEMLISNINTTTTSHTATATTVATLALTKGYTIDTKHAQCYDFLLRFKSTDNTLSLKKLYKKDFFVEFHTNVSYHD